MITKIDYSTGFKHRTFIPSNAIVLPFLATVKCYAWFDHDGTPLHATPVKIHEVLEWSKQNYYLTLNKH